MSFLKAIDTDPSFAPRESGPLPERLISGNPTEGGEPLIYKAGDSFVMKPGYVGVWKTIETVTLLPPSREPSCCGSGEDRPTPLVTACNGSGFPTATHPVF